MNKIRIRSFHKFSLSKLIQRAHQKITSDPDEPQKLYTRLTQDFRSQLNKRSEAHYSHNIAATVAKLHLSDHRHVRLVNLLSKSKSPPLPPASSSSSSSSLPVLDHPLLPPHTLLPQTQTLLPDLYAALDHVPEADPSDYALAILLTNQHAPSRHLALCECKDIYSLYLARHPTLAPDLDDALDPLTQLVRTYLVHGQISDALALINPLIASPEFSTWLNNAPRPRSSSDATTPPSRYASALHLFAQAMAGLRLHNDLDSAARLFRTAQRLLCMDLYFPFEPRPPYTCQPAPLTDQSASSNIWPPLSTQTADQTALVSARVGHMWHVLTLGGYPKDGYRVLMERMVVGDKLDARVAGSVMTELFSSRQLGPARRGRACGHAHAGPNHGKWPNLRLADQVWVAVFHALPTLTHLGSNDHVGASKWWVPLSKMASVRDPTRAVRHTQQQHPLPPLTTITYLEQVVNLYAAYLSRTPSASPAASVASAFVDCVCKHMADER
ncbi:hypothetical protein BCR44DRAFT_1511806 [Catenaria anguillulae PL171]|uniref:Uncharacterized protein n=1 Tax=Catenaria anguillulae PL171 TaxID=765915 RepID=A0A1Y2HRI4_9FUNG|nr:hypothetical protein BCR44DRAFT_1511806 [Catenaria anguillulae PL171]